MTNRRINEEDAKVLFPNTEAVTNADITDILVNAEIIELIKKYGIYLATRDGVEGICLNGSTKPNEKTIEKIKKLKPEIMKYLNDKKEQQLQNKKYMEEARENKIQELIKSGKAVLAIVESGSYQCDKDIYYVCPVDEEEKLQYAEWCRNEMHDYVKHVYKINDRKLLKEMIKDKKSNGMLRGEGYCYYITQAQMEQLIKNDNEIKQEKELNVAKRDENEQERITEIFKVAKETGIKQVLSSSCEPCNDKNEECSTDIVTRYAMPDGTTQIVRNHTW